MFKKPVKVKCYTLEELGKMVHWLREDEGLSALNHQHYAVTAVLPMQYWENPHEVMYFEVEVPYYKFKKLREEFIAEEAFDPILQQRAFDQILGRHTWK